MIKILSRASRCPGKGGLVVARWKVLAVSLLVLSPGVVDCRSIAATAADEPSAFSLAYVPRDVLAVVALRPQVLLERPAVKPFAEAIREMVVDSFGSPVEPSDVAEVTVFALPSGDTGASFAMKLRLGTAEGAERFVAEFQRGSQPIPFAGVTYLLHGKYFTIEDFFGTIRLH